jgi:K+-transporting ATPase ATPase C chain
MKTSTPHPLRPAITLFLLLRAVLGGLYPLLVTGWRKPSSRSRPMAA